jgi:hypothetical protein
MEEVRLLNALLDVNLLLDVFLEREPWSANGGRSAYWFSWESVQHRRNPVCVR